VQGILPEAKGDVKHRDKLWRQSPFYKFRTQFCHLAFMLII